MVNARQKAARTQSRLTVVKDGNGDKAADPIVFGPQPAPGPATATTRPTRQTAAQKRAEAKAAAELAAALNEDAQAATNGKPQARPEGAAEAVRTTKTPKVKQPGKSEIQRVIAEALVVTGAQLVTGWVPADHKVGEVEISQETAREAVGRWLSYLPNCTWPTDVLGTRSNAGRPGGKDGTRAAS